MKIASLLAVVVLLATSGCNLVGLPREAVLRKEAQFREVHVGMTKDEAVTLLGRPTSSGRSFGVWKTKDLTSRETLELRVYFDTREVIRSTWVTRRQPSPLMGYAQSGGHDSPSSLEPLILPNRDPRFDGVYQAYPMSDNRPPNVPFPDLITQSR